jgi:hypothetical protein
MIELRIAGLMRTYDTNKGQVTCSLKVNIGQEDQTTTTYFRLVFFGTALTQED